MKPSARITLLASIAAMFLAASATPTPLYATYARTWGLTAADISLVFGVYALVVLLSLLTLGRLSDHIGRRPVIVAAIAGQICSLAVFATAGGLDQLLIGRAIQGVSAGAGIAALGAALLDVDNVRGGVANAVAPPAGSALGALGAALAVVGLPGPTHAIYLIVAGLLLAQGLLVLRLPESVTPHPGAWGSLRPEVALPAAVRTHFASAAPVLFAVWALTGLFGSLGPSLIARITGSSSPVYGVLPLVLVGGVSPFSSYFSRTWPARRALTFGIVGLLGGAGLSVAGALAPAGPLLLAGAAVAGAGFGWGFRGSLQLVLPGVAPHERAGTLSLLYVVSYVGFGLPAIAAGRIDDATHNLTGTTVGYAAVLAGLALLASVVLFGSRSKTAPCTGTREVA